MNNVLEWVKANVFIVVFCVIMIAAPVGMWFFTSGLNSDVKAEVQKRAANLPQLNNIKKVNIEIPGLESEQGVINDKFIEEYTVYANALGQDADAVRTAAIEYNRKGRDVLMKDVFPAMPPQRREVLPQDFHEKLLAAYDALLRDVGAGAPPDLESLRDDLTRTSNTFITQKLQQAVEDPLDEEKKASLRQHLAERRLFLYTTAADGVNVYLTTDNISTVAPRDWDQKSLPTPAELFRWQWEYWVLHDVIKALGEANRVDQKVYRAPVKQITYIAAAVPSGGVASSTGSRGGGLLPPDSSGSMVGGEDDESAGMPPSSAGASADPKMQIPFDYNASITGRKSNPLYDVINVDLELIVETERLPQVIDALSKYNFFTVAAMSVSHSDPAADPFNAAREGYIYGIAPVSLVKMRLETIWLRDWITPFMPDDLKKSLGISVPGSLGQPVAAPPPEEEEES